MNPRQKWARDMVTIGWVVLGALVGQGCAPERPASIYQDDYAFTKDYLSWMIRNQMSRDRISGLSIALVDDQELVWSAGFGLADRAEDRTYRADTVSSIASVTKIFTATAVMQLAEQGLISLDDPFVDYVPEFAIQTVGPYGVQGRLRDTHRVVIGLSCC